MRILIELWILGIGLDLLKYHYEMRGNVFLGLHVWLMKLRYGIELYKPYDSSYPLFNIKFPLFHMSNESVIKPTLAGKILWFTIGGEK